MLYSTSNQIYKVFYIIDYVKRKVLVIGVQLLMYVLWGRRGRDRMVVGFTTTYAISAYHR